MSVRRQPQSRGHSRRAICGALGGKDNRDRARWGDYGLIVGGAAVSEDNLHIGRGSELGKK